MYLRCNSNLILGYGMKNQLILIGLVAVLLCVGLSGCDQINNVLKSEKDRFIGTWVRGNWPQNDTTIPQLILTFQTVAVR